MAVTAKPPSAYIEAVVVAVVVTVNSPPTSRLRERGKFFSLANQSPMAFFQRREVW
jgi:hypothetical protein